MKTRIQVSIHPQLVAVAEKLMVDDMFNSFSAYMEKLIREEESRRRATGGAINPAAAEVKPTTPRITPLRSPEEVKRLLRSSQGTTAATATKARKVRRA